MQGYECVDYQCFVNTQTPLFEGTGREFDVEVARHRAVIEANGLEISWNGQKGKNAILAVSTLIDCFRSVDGMKNPDDFATLGRATPFAGRRVFGENLLTVYNGSVVYRKNTEEE